MFDLRYHVVSLAAVFLALVFGILIGVGISGRGLVQESERRNLNRQIADLEQRLDEAEVRSRTQDAALSFTDAAYEAVMHDRLAGRRFALVFVGTVDRRLDVEVEQAIEDAGGEIVRLRALKVPLREEELDTLLRSRPGLARYRGAARMPDLGRDLGREVVRGGDTPLWSALTRALVEERSGGGEDAVDGVVVARSASPQQRMTARFLEGFYEGLTVSDQAVGVETTSTPVSAVDVFRRAGLSSVDAVDTTTGKVALAVLLAGGRPGHYGVKNAPDGALPPVEPVVRERTRGE